METDKNAIDPAPQKIGNSIPYEGIGIGIFALIAGALLFAEQWELIPPIKWFVPLVLIVFGGVAVARALIARK
jgi:hypothetical protein